MRAPPPPPWFLVLAAPADGPGVEAVLGRARDEAAGGAQVRVLLTEDGLAALDGPWPETLRAAGARLSLCARGARTRGVDPKGAPACVAWSSLAAFLRDAAPEARVTSVFP